MPADLAQAFLDQSRTYLRGDYRPRIERALATLSDEDLWWRPNAASNSAGNLVLHLAGNVRQWIVAGLGGAPDVRERDAEFAATGGVAAAECLARLRASVDDACAILERLDAEALARQYIIQAHDVTGMEAVYHVVEHFGMHTGQILWIAKARTGAGLGFYAERPGGLAKLTWTPTPDGPEAP
ncbi:MAG: DUF1572 family protein [Rhodothermaceae bacterium]|nr:DUF1572 family protein [Rhodothermaceae bacterium]